MLTLGDLMKADIDSPIQIDCEVCAGAGAVRTPALIAFVDRHGTTTLAQCQSAMQAARSAAGIRNFEVSWIPTKEQLIAESIEQDVAGDYRELLQAGSSVACHPCNGTGSVLSEFGLALLALRAQLDRLDRLVSQPSDS